MKKKILLARASLKNGSSGVDVNVVVVVDVDRLNSGHFSISESLGTPKFNKSSNKKFEFYLEEEKYGCRAAAVLQQCCGQHY